MKALHALLSFNRGLVSRLALGRVDLKRTGLSAEIQTNWMPRVLGSMMLRPGLGYIGATKNNAAAKLLPFTFTTSDHIILELTALVMRIWDDHTLITRPAVTTSITNDTFDTDLTGWTDSDESGAVSAWATGGYLSLLGTGVNSAIRNQEVTVNETSTEHGLSIYVPRGTVILRVGSTSGDDDFLSDTTLREGYHSISVTPTSNMWIRLSNSTNFSSLVSSIEIEVAGAVELTTVWPETSLQDIRIDQSGDVIFVACKDYQQQRIERQATRSWSVVKYLVEDGPFKVINIGPIRITPSALSGDITLSASKDLFKPTNVGSLYELISNGQQVSASITAEDTWSNHIRVTGVGSSQRQFSITLSGTWVSTVKLQRSVGEPGDWVDVKSYTVNATDNYNDGLDNQIIYYRVGVDTGDYTSGTVVIAINYTAGSITGIARVTAYLSATSVSASVLVALGGTSSTDDWAESEWSDRRGWPTSVVLHDGRLWWSGKDKIFGSVSDGFSSFDANIEGDSGPIQRSIGAGPVDVINWLVSTTNLLVGADGSELVARASSLDEPLTPSNFGLKPAETLGSSNIAAVKIGTNAVFVQRNGSRVYELSLGGSYNYEANDLTAIVPEIGLPSFTRMAVQRQPDTRIHIVRSDGKVAVLIYDKVENVTCWMLVETDGLIEDVITLPGTEEDEVYYVVNRTIDGVSKRYIEEWSLESECIGGATNRCMDSHITYSGASTTTITGLDHLEGESVVVWGNTKDLGSYIVSDGSITLTEAVTLAYVGLTYTARFKSAKLATAVATQQNPTPLTQRKRIDHLGLVLADTHASGLKYGVDFDNLDDLPLVDGEEVIDPDTIHADFDTDSMELNGEWSTDTRLCLQATSPKPCTVLAAIVGISSHDKL
jgi:hypothetical protein